MCISNRHYGINLTTIDYHFLATSLETPQTSLIDVPPIPDKCPFFLVVFFIPTSGRLHSLSHRRASSTHICVYQNQCSGSPSVNDSGGLEPRRMCETTVVELLTEIRWRSSQLPKWKDAFVYIHNTSRNCAMYFLTYVDGRE